jgi:hypothetical protein
MKRRVLKVPYAISFVSLFIALVISFPVVDNASILFVRNAEARIGRPGSPTSVAGVARRTTRRTVRRHRYVTTLPRGCTTVVTRGVTYHRCGGVYYQPSYQGTQLVYVEVENP